MPYLPPGLPEPNYDEKKVPVFTLPCPLEKADGTKATCYFTLDGVKEAYEVSFVAVPAQPRAGTHKSIGFTKPVAEKEETPVVETPVVDETTDNEKMDERIVSSRIARANVLFNTKN